MEPADTRHKISVEFAERPVAEIKPLEKHLLDLVFDIYKINEEERKNIPFEFIEEPTGCHFVFQLLEIGDKKYHHQFTDELKKNVHTRELFKYFQEISFANRDITIFQNLDQQFKQIIKKELKMEDIEKVLNIDYTTMKSGRIKMTFTIPVFYKEVNDAINWIKIFKTRDETRNVCQCKGILKFKTPKKFIQDTESLVKPIQDIMRKTLKMKQGDVVNIKFGSDEDDKLTMTFVAPYLFRKQSNKTDWHSILAQEEKTEHLIRIRQPLLFVNCTEAVIKEHHDDIVQIIADELEIKNNNHIQLIYETSGSEVRLTFDVPSRYQEIIPDKNWIEIIEKHENTRSMFLQRYRFNLKDVTYKCKDDFSMIKGFASDISKAPTKNISVEIGDNLQCEPMTICIPEYYSTKDFQTQMGEQFKNNMNTLFEHTPKN